MRGGCNNRMMKEVRIFFSSSNRVLYNFKMAHRVKSIRETLDVINKERQEYNLGQDNTGNAAQDGRRYDMLKKKAIRFDDDPYFLQSNLIGRGRDMKKICDRLLDNSISDENVSVVPIVGIGGLGKTSLAKLIYDDEKVKKYYGIRFWVCVSDNFDERIIMRKILQQYDGSGKPEDCIIDKLPKNIEGKKYLLVLDDVWNKNQTRWLNLMKFLRNSAKGSKILVTTRDEDVARTMTRDESYKLKGLSKEKSLSLLMKMAYKKEGEWKNQRLEEIGTEIANKCCGVPLAIMTIARLLCSKDTDKDWEVFNSREFANIKQEAGDILPTLKLSYDILPSQLKQCFTYCRLFPKDYEFKPIDLIDLWMAQGFLKSPYNRSMEDVGRDYFMELVWGSFFQDIEKDVYGNVIMCKMHDLMHDLAQKEAGSNFALVDNSNTATYCHGEVLHVSIYKDEVSKWVGEAHSRARSLLCFEAVKEDLIKDISKNFRNTRVLWLPKGVHPKEVPKEIGKLNHLRSLNLSFSTFESLPPSISKLYNLETLNLEQCWYLIELPRGITELVRLRHLNIKWCRKLTHMPMGIGKLTNLEMLSDFIVGEKGKDDADGLDELSKLKGLTNDLKLSHLERLGKGTNGSFPIKSLNLQSLELHWDWDAKEDKQVPTHSEEEKEAILDRLQPHSNLKGLIIRGYMGCTFSSWVFQLHELVVLEIWDCKYCTYLSPIHQLPFLKSLYLLRLSGLEYIEDGYMSSTFFPSLQEIKMYGLPNFKGWVNLQGNDSQGKEIPEEGDDFLLPIFPTVITVIRLIPITKSHIGGLM
ncbi:hypothetical protein SAY87_006389 [Trapa incisa]|uniref:NB-ARC domain-containing protein n=1 Tax=Trapa incisa TaxID=236973 RepID=A0AAN7K0M4_9MYRT|nr:hypothetical protein SAY87_006389 [Trapa incisa]